MLGKAWFTARCFLAIPTFASAMTLTEAQSLIVNAPVPNTRYPAIWADLGCGSGLFTHALASLLPAGSIIYGIDKTVSLQASVTSNGVRIIPMQMDFAREDIPLQGLDGMLMANSLHYVKDKITLLTRLRSHMKAGAGMLMVEYDIDKPVPVWVPYPVGFLALEQLFRAIGGSRVLKLGVRPSAYGRGDLYSAWIRL